jgi:hypothetical protein
MKTNGQCPLPHHDIKYFMQLKEMLKQTTLRKLKVMKTALGCVKYQAIVEHPKGFQWHAISHCSYIQMAASPCHCSLVTADGMISDL